MSILKIIEAFKAAPTMENVGMVQEIWEDGEITLTKGGGLFRQRSLHCMAMPVLKFADSQYIAKELGAELRRDGKTFKNISILASDATCETIRQLMFKELNR